MLGHGYSGARLTGIVVGFSVATMDTELYGPQQAIACISIALDRELAAASEAA